MALPATLVSALGFGVPLAAVATGAVLFATAGSGAAPGGGGIPTVWLDSPHEASVLAAGEVPVVVHATAERAPTSLVLLVDGAVVGERQAGPPVLGRLSRPSSRGRRASVRTPCRRVPVTCPRRWFRWSS